MDRESANSTLGTGAGLGAILLWSGTFAVARSVGEQVGSLQAGAAAYLLGGAFCLARFLARPRRRERLRRLGRREVLACGALFALYTASIYLAVGWARDRDQLLEIALVNYLWPTATVLLSLPLLRLAARPTLWLGTMLALTGVFLAMTHGSAVTWAALVEHLAGNPAPYLLALLAAISWAFYSNLTRRWAQPGGEEAVLLFLPATGLLLLAMAPAAPGTGRWSAGTLGEAALLGAITAASYALWDVAMRRGHLLLVAACSYFTPLLSTLVSCAYLRVAPGTRLWLGSLLIVAGSWITWRSVSSPPAPELPPRRSASSKVGT